MEKKSVSNAHKMAVASMVNAKNCIRIKGAKEHNLKNIDLDIPRDQFVVLTGLSGSGKSSLAKNAILGLGFL